MYLDMMHRLKNKSKLAPPSLELAANEVFYYYVANIIRRQSEKNDLKNACKFIHFSDRNCRYNLYRFKLTVKQAI